MPDIRRWLEEQGLGAHAEAFADNGVDFRALRALSEEDLEALGLKLGPRRVLQQAIAELDLDAASRASRPVGTDEAERRQLTILFCDLVGSTALSRDLDPEDLRELMRAYEAVCQGAIERFGGHVARFMGDGVLAYFGYPEAHEDDAGRAVHAALALVESVPGIDRRVAGAGALQVRIGIATGPVVVGDVIGPGTTREHAVVGQTPNVAARLQSLAPPDGILIGPLTHALAGGAFDYEPLGPCPIKGLPEPIVVHRVQGANRAHSRFEAARAHVLTPLVGRDEALELLERRWRRARTGEGQLVLVGGEAGIGKSRLAEALRQRIRADPHVRILYQCSPHHTDSALYPVVAQLEHASEIVAGDDLVERARKLEAVLATGVPVEGHDAALLADLVGVEHEALPEAARGGRERRAATLGALTRQFQALGAERPVLCVFEDLHWADASTLELVEQLVELVERLPVLLVLTFRPEFEHSWAGLAHCLLLALPRMRRSDAARIAAHVAGTRRIAPAALETLVSRSDGVPLYVEEMTRALVDGGGLDGRASDDHGERATDPVPETLRDSLMGRLDRLGPGKTLAQVAAVLGREFTRESLARLSAVTPDALDAGLGELEAAGIARPRTGARGEWIFKHALVQEVAYESLLRRTRQDLHARAAEVLRELDPGLERARPELVAHHYAGAADEAQALHWWDLAARRAVERGALAEAIGHLHRALGTLGDAGRERERAAVACDLRLRMAESMRVLERGEDAFEALDETQALATRHGLAPALARTHTMRGNLFFPLGDTEGCEREHRLGLDWARRAGDRACEASARGGLGDAAYVRGRFRSAAEHFERCVHLARAGDLPELEGAYLPMFAVVRHIDLEMEEALALAAEGIDVCRRTGALRPQMIAQACIGFCEYESGHLSEAETALEATISLARTLGARRFEPVGLYHLAKVHLASGSRERAVKTAREALSVALETAVSFVGARCYGGLATVTDDPDECERALAEGAALLAAGCVPHNHLHYYRDAMAIRLRQGQLDEVELLAGALEAQFVEEPNGWSTFWVALGRALAAHARREGGADASIEITRLHGVAGRQGMRQAQVLLEDLT